MILSLHRITHSCHDDASRFVRMMATNGCNYLTEDDFVPLVQVRLNESVCLREREELDTLDSLQLSLYLN